MSHEGAKWGSSPPPNSQALYSIVKNAVDTLLGTAVKITLSTWWFPVPKYLLKPWAFHCHSFEICDITLITLNRGKQAKLIAQHSNTQKLEFSSFWVPNYLLWLFKFDELNSDWCFTYEFFFLCAISFCVPEASDVNSSLNGKFGLQTLENEGCFVTLNRPWRFWRFQNNCWRQ